MGEPHAIAVLHDVIAKRKKEYQSVPSKLYNQVPPKSDATYWMGFESSKYYPIGIVDAAGVAIISAEPLVETLTWTAPNGVTTSTTITAHSSKNIYWFKALRVYVSGSLEVTFSAPTLPQLSPLSFHISIEEKPITGTTTPAPAPIEPPAPLSVSLPRLLPNATDSTLPPYLHQLLLDDATRVATMSSTPLTTNMPSCHNSVVEHMKKILSMRGYDRKAKKGIADRSIADTLLCLFDSMFCSHLLYPTEPKPSHSHPSNAASAIHLLRFTVLLQNMLQTQCAEESEKNEEMVSYVEFCDDMLKYLESLAVCDFF